MAGTTPKELFIQCGDVAFSERRLREINSGRVMVSVDRDAIHGIRYRHGFVAPHPVLQIVFGVALTAVAYVPLVHLLNWLQYGGTLFSNEVWLITAAIFGVWLLTSAFRRGIYLQVDSAQGRKRFVFGKKTNPAEVESFLALLETICGLRVQREFIPISGK